MVQITVLCVKTNKPDYSNVTLCRDKTLDYYLVGQLLSPFMLVGDFNAHNNIWDENKKIPSTA
jgi:hypothetical protein